MQALKKIVIHREPRCPVLDAEAVAEFVSGCLPGAEVLVQGPLPDAESLGDDETRRLARELAAARVRRPQEPPAEVDPLPGEVEYEARRLENRHSRVFGVLYDGYRYSEILRGLLGPEESRLERLHVVITNQLLGTWEEADRRFHARVVVLGSPSLVSTSGAVVAPARERGYYVARSAAEAMGMPEEEKQALARRYAGDCLEHDDPRLTEVAKGYVMQAVVYRLTGEAFCEDHSCRLFNAHWQRELLAAQLGGEDFCERHRLLLEDT